MRLCFTKTFTTNLPCVLVSKSRSQKKDKVFMSQCPFKILLSDIIMKLSSKVHHNSMSNMNVDDMQIQNYTWVVHFLEVNQFHL